MRYNDERGFGDVIAVEGNMILVRFDADPWYPVWVELKGEEND